MAFEERNKTAAYVEPEQLSLNRSWDERYTPAQLEQAMFVRRIMRDHPGI